MPDTPSQTELAQAIRDATRAAVVELFERHRGSFYYVALITTPEGHAPVLSAWSREALAAYPAESESERELIKWSYADSPYGIYGEEHFQHVPKLFELRPAIGSDMSQEEWDAELDLRIAAMEMALAQLDAEGLFGRGVQRQSLLLNVEVVPPDPSNTDRALRLNPEGAALDEYLEEAAE